MGDVEDPDIYSAVLIGEFLKSEKGIWVNEYCRDLMSRIHMDEYGYRVVVTASFSDKHATAYYLKFN